jgi:Na+-transporting NADH:ubiquinone oxidoreductase subunit NqrF
MGGEFHPQMAGVWHGGVYPTKETLQNSTCAEFSATISITCDMEDRILGKPPKMNETIPYVRISSYIFQLGDS